MGPATPEEHRADQFASTAWSLVLQAAGTGLDSDKPLALLCRLYWLPLYTFARRQGHNQHDAEDLTQGFFAHLLEHRSLAAAQPERGRFRSFLLTSFRHFMLNEQARSAAMKRGGGSETLPLSEAVEAEVLGLVSRTDLSPDQIFDQTWALAVLDQARRRLELYYEKDGKADWFAQVQPFLQSGARTADYETIARNFGMTRNAVAVAIHRMHHRYRDLVRTVIAETVADRGDTDEELAHLLASLAT